MAASSSRILPVLRRGWGTLASTSSLRQGLLTSAPASSRFWELRRNLHVSAPKADGDAGWNYRGVYDDEEGANPRFHNKLALGIMTFMYSWMFWGIFTEPDHLYGHNLAVDTSVMSDKELGIPEDN